MILKEGGQYDLVQFFLSKCHISLALHNFTDKDMQIKHLLLIINIKLLSEESANETCQRLRKT